MHAEIAETFHKMHEWLRDKHGFAYATLDEPVRLALMAAPEHKRLDEAINTAALADDVTQTKNACRAYLRYWREALKAAETSSVQQKTVVE